MKSLAVFIVLPRAMFVGCVVLSVPVQHLSMHFHMRGILGAREFDLAKWTFLIYFALFVCLEMKI